MPSTMYCYPDGLDFQALKLKCIGIKERFFEKCQLPGVVGAVDGTHVAIVPPVHAEEHMILNRNNFHSKNVQIVCDYNLKILALNVGTEVKPMILTFGVCLSQEDTCSKIMLMVTEHPSCWVTRAIPLSFGS